MCVWKLPIVTKLSFSKLERIGKMYIFWCKRYQAIVLQKLSRSSIVLQREKCLLGCQLSKSNCGVVNSGPMVTTLALWDNMPLKKSFGNMSGTKVKKRSMCNSMFSNLDYFSGAIPRPLAAG